MDHIDRVERFGGGVIIKISFGAVVIKGRQYSMRAVGGSCHKKEEAESYRFFLSVNGLCDKEMLGLESKRWKETCFR